MNLDFLGRPEDRKKTIGLLVGCVLVFVFIVFRVMSVSQGGQAPGPNPVVQIGADASTSGGTTPGSAPTPVAKNDQITIPPVAVSAQANPFHIKTPAPITQPPPVVTKIATTAPLQQPSKRTAPGDGKAVRMHGPIGGSGDGEPFFVEPVQVTMQVMGVASGRNPVAVIRMDSRNYIVPRGGYFGNGLRVKEVSDSQVVIEQGKQLRILRVSAGSSDGLPTQAIPQKQPVPGAELLGG